MEIARDEVRVMTVHGAKGLEAPVVILADTMTQPSGPRPPRLLELPDGAVIWGGRKDDDPPPVAAAREAALSEAEDEYRRLLYVAMTRAADRLIICGADGERQRPKGCWYDLVVEPLQPFLVEDNDNGEKVWRFRKEPPAAAAKASLAPVSAATRSSNSRHGCGDRLLPRHNDPSSSRHQRHSRRILAERLHLAARLRPSGARRWPAAASCIG